MGWPPTVAPLNVVHVSAEVAPFSGTGGLSEVLAGLSPALTEFGVNTCVITPCYRSVPTELYQPTDVEVKVTVGERQSRVRVCQGEIAGAAGLVPIYLLDCPEAYDREGLYGPDEQTDYPDNAWRFALLCEAALVLAHRLRLHPDIMHCHDWQAGLLPVHCSERLGGWVRSVLTIHNLGYQGTFPSDTVEEIGLERVLFQPDGVEFWGWLSFLKGGLMYADKLVAPSPTYAREILTEQYGHGLDGVLRRRPGDIVGVLNGITLAEYAPQDGIGIAAPFDTKDLGGKKRCQQALAAELGLIDDETPILGIVSRLVQQKGIDLVPEALIPLLESGSIRLAALASGSDSVAYELEELAARWPDRVGVRLAFDKKMAARVFAGSDALLVPSRYEPCGIVQMVALRYGTLPIARLTGGLADTIEEGRTGFLFPDQTGDSLRAAVERFLEAWKSPSKVEEMRLAAMREDFSWTRSAACHAALYEEVHRGDRS